MRSDYGIQDSEPTMSEELSIKLLFVFQAVSSFVMLFYVASKFRLIRVINKPHKKENYFFIAFYMTLLATHIVRNLSSIAALYLCVTGLEGDPIKNKGFIRVLLGWYYAPKCIQIACYCLKSMLCLTLSYKARFDKFDLIRVKPVISRKLFRAHIWIFILIEMIVLAMLVISYLSGYFETYILFVGILTSSGAALGMFVGYELIKSCSFSGTPFLNKIAASKSKTVQSIANYWTLGMMIFVIITAAMLILSEMIYSSLQGFLLLSWGFRVMFYCILLLELLMNEVFGGLFCLSRRYIESFYFHRGTFKESITTPLRGTDYFAKHANLQNNLLGKKSKDDGMKALKTADMIVVEEKDGEDETNQDDVSKANPYKYLMNAPSYQSKSSDEALTDLPSKNRQTYQTDRFTQKSDLKSLRTQWSDRKEMNPWLKLRFQGLDIKDLDLDLGCIKGTDRPGSFGKSHRGKYKRLSITARKMAVDDVSPFILRELPEEIKSWKKVIETGIEHPLGFIIENDKSLWIISQGISDSYISMHEFIKTYSSQTDPKLKIQIALDLCSILMRLFATNKEKAHPHLSPSNVLIHPNTFDIKIIDFGFTSLRRYCSLVGGYVNKDQYTAPELFKLKGKVAVTQNEASNVYSTAMILWYLFSGVEPFGGLEKTAIRELILVQKSRPQLPGHLHPKLGELIRKCWDEDENSRPNFIQITDTLTKLVLDSTTNFSASGS